MIENDDVLIFSYIKVFSKMKNQFKFDDFSIYLDINIYLKKH